MLPQMDATDYAIESIVKKTPGISIFKAIEPFLREKSETVLRVRVRQLALRDKIRIEKGRHESKLYPVNGKGDGL